jgi:hypothetical protein
MLNDMIQSISAYAEALEQKLSALEQRVALLEEANQAMKQEGDEAKALVATLQAEVATLAAAGIASQATEPEVEIELVVADEADLAEELVEEPMPEEPIAEPEEEEVEETVAPITLEPTVEEQPQEETAAEPVEGPVAEVVVEQPAPQPQPAPQVEPVSRPMPQQTSLFGAAVEDIRQAISLGDRFLFQRELFAGNGELMQKTLDELNALGSLEEAMDYVADNFEWDSDSTAVQLFENVLKRRFA